MNQHAMRTMIRTTMWMVILAMLALSPGCEREQAAPPPPTPKPTLYGPGTATLPEFQAQFNRHAQQGYMRAFELAKMLAPETDEQRTFLENLVSISKAESLDDAMLSLFGEVLDQTGVDRRKKFAVSMIREITPDEQGDRATAHLAGVSDPEMSTLPLVQVNGRWYLSGNNWSRDGGAFMRSLAARITPYEVSAEIAPQLAQRVRLGQFPNADETRIAFAQELRAYLEAHPGLAEEIQRVRFGGRADGKPNVDTPPADEGD